MTAPVVIIGMGEMGELFAVGFLKMGIPVYPITRQIKPKSIANEIPRPSLVLVAVGEDDLDESLERLPLQWLDKVVLLQNELIPWHWQKHGIQNPTVIIVWLDKKKGRPPVNVLPTLVGGPYAERIKELLESIGVPCKKISTDEITYELVRKNLYILTINLAGLLLPTNTTVNELWDQHRSLAEGVFNEILLLQQKLAATSFGKQQILEGVLEAFRGDPDHICTGRSASKRLKRVVRLANQVGASCPKLKQIQSKTEPRSVRRL